MTVVLDTNVIVAALVAKGLCHEVVVRALGSGTVVTSPALLDELEQTLRAKFTLGPAAMAFLEQLRLRVHLVAATALAAPVSRDADDDVVLATAVAANATVIVTGDRDLLVLRSYRGSRSSRRATSSVACRRDPHDAPAHAFRSPSCLRGPGRIRSQGVSSLTPCQRRVRQG